MTRPASHTLLLQLAGSWHVGGSLPSPKLVAKELEREPTERLRFGSDQVDGWDTALVSFAARVLTMCRGASVSVDPSGLPAGAQRLLTLIEASPIEHTSPARRRSVLTRIGMRALAWRSMAAHALADIGALTVALAKLAVAKAKFRRSELWLQMQATGAAALGIVGLVAGLVGLIIAFISAVQLELWARWSLRADAVVIDSGETRTRVATTATDSNATASALSESIDRLAADVAVRVKRADVVAARKGSE